LDLLGGALDLPDACPEELATLARICSTFQLQSLEPQLRACQELAGARGGVEIAVLGQFKSGKSSFLNSLIGFEALPVDVLPATAVVTRVRFGMKESVHVHYKSGEVRDVPFASVADFVTEHGNPVNAKQVATVDIELPALTSFPSLQFVDTPGLGSAFSHNTETSLAWLPRLGGALLAVSADRPPGEQDLDLLVAMLRHTPEVSILLTKADLVTGDQLESILRFSRDRVLERLGREVPLLPYSTRPGFETMREAVLDHLHRMEGGWQDLRVQILGHKLRGLAEACQAYLHLAERSAQSAAEARTELEQALDREKAALRTLDQEIALLARDVKVRTRTALDRRFQASRGEVARRIAGALRVEMDGWDGSLSAWIQRFQSWMERALQAEMSALSPRGRDLTLQFLHEANESLQRTVRAFQGRLAAAIQRALGLSFAGARFEREVREPAAPDIHLGKTFETHWELLEILIPMSIFRPVVKRHFLRRVPWETEKQLSRLTNQWAETTEAALDGLASRATAFMRDEVAALESLAASSVDRMGEIQAGLQSLESILGAQPETDPIP
jgi:GTP-binding protein EngB required for normal cell division